MKKNKIRYAVVGLGYISQIAVLPAFKNAFKNSELTALVSDDEIKLKLLGKKYKVKHTYSYAQYLDCLNSGYIDAVYIALPNTMHRHYTLEAANAGIHVLCEKPMAVSSSECQEMLNAAEENKIKLMIAYRLHFEKANLKAAQIAQSEKLGDVRFFNSAFSMQVKDKNIRLKKSMGGGPLYDIGIYCINAARNIFADEPIEVFAMAANNGDKRFKEVDEMVTGVLRFPGDRLATFTCSFGASDVSAYQVVGTKGSLRVDPAYEMVDTLEHLLKIKGKTKKESFPKRDQFAPELIYFSDCILKDKVPEPSGVEGLEDVRVIEALTQSIKMGSFVSLNQSMMGSKPLLPVDNHQPPIKKPDLIHAQEPSYS